VSRLGLVESLGLRLDLVTDLGLGLRVGVSVSHSVNNICASAPIGSFDQ